MEKTVLAEIETNKDPISLRVKCDGIELFTEAFGNHDNPTILLIMGATAQGVMWKNTFCDNLAKLGYFVIRYDHRDTGKSSRVDYNQSPYHLRDLANDARSILDAYSIEKAIWVGASMGSFIAQMNAIYHPQRVTALVCIMSSPNHLAFVDGFAGRDMGEHMLPAPNAKILKYYQALLGIEGQSTQQAMAAYKEILLQIVETKPELVDIRVAEGLILRRLKNNKYIHNHSFALAFSESLQKDVPSIIAPTLIIHGLEDYILPIEHGKMLASLMKHAHFIEYKDMGHCLPDDILEEIGADLIAFLSRS